MYSPKLKCSFFFFLNIVTLNSDSYKRFKFRYCPLLTYFQSLVCVSHTLYRGPYEIQVLPNPQLDFQAHFSLVGHSWYLQLIQMETCVVWRFCFGRNPNNRVTHLSLRPPKSTSKCRVTLMKPDQYCPLTLQGSCHVHSRRPVKAWIIMLLISEEQWQTRLQQ